ncbi:hypothetical protein [Limnoglobus roseus]|uniref:Uncharacterized protein n=1 Tax=Limnoglobus roseus TaxID=2598579 RepID=A0A5C1A4L4_9BACT|nr:hypothetical protein [Limnoglobus roseus]QEL14049.1 hypothetical protein PX52LOC_00912 [Limnoglobus roseus]
MSDPLKQSVDRITSFATTLNKASDSLICVIKDLEDFLAQNGVGVSTYVEIKRSPDIFDGPDDITSVGYDRWEGKFRIVVWEGTDQSAGTCKPWGECDRATKLLSASFLPQLLKRIADDLEQDAKSAMDAAEQVAKAIEPALKSKGGKK